MGNSPSRYGYDSRYPAALPPGYMPSYPALPPWRYEKKSKWNPLRLFDRSPTYEDAMTYYHAAPMLWQLPPGSQYPGAVPNGLPEGVPPGRMPIPGPALTNYMPVIPRRSHPRRRHRSSSISSGYSTGSGGSYDSYDRYLGYRPRRNPLPRPPKDILATTPYRGLLAELPSQRSRSHRHTDHHRSHSYSHSRRHHRDREREDEREREERRRRRLERQLRSERELERARDRDREPAYGRKHHRSFSETAAAFLGPVLGHTRPGYGMPEPHLAPPGADPPPVGPEAPPPGPPPGSDVPPMHILGGGGGHHHHTPVIPGGGPPGATMQMPTPGMGMPTSGTGVAMPGVGGMHMPTPQGGANAMPMPDTGPATMQMPTPGGHGHMQMPTPGGYGPMQMPTPGGRGGGLAMPTPGMPMPGAAMSMPSPGMRPGATMNMPSPGVRPGATPHPFAGGGMPMPGSAHGMPAVLNVPVMPSPSMPMPPPMAMPNLVGEPIRFTGYGLYNALLHTSPHRVLYEDELYPTAMHLFEAMKFMHHRPDVADRIREAESPFDALEVSKRHDAAVRLDWDQVALNMMDEALYHKFRQNNDARQVLFNTGNAPLVFDDHDDSFWGVGRDDRGRNEMGQSLARVREKLRQELGPM